jgi:hypothetical protein
MREKWMLFTSAFLAGFIFACLVLLRDKVPVLAWLSMLFPLLGVSVSLILKEDEDTKSSASMVKEIKTE